MNSMLGRSLIQLRMKYSTPEHLLGEKTRYIREPCSEFQISHVCRDNGQPTPNPLCLDTLRIGNNVLIKGVSPPWDSAQLCLCRPEHSQVSWLKRYLISGMLQLTDTTDVGSLTIIISVCPLNGVPVLATVNIPRWKHALWLPVEGVVNDLIVNTPKPAFLGGQEVSVRYMTSFLPKCQVSVYHWWVTAAVPRERWRYLSQWSIDQVKVGRPLEQVSCQNERKPMNGTTRDAKSKVLQYQSLTSLRNKCHFP